MILDKSILLFDLDGTIIDSRVGVTRAVRYSLAHFGIEAPASDDLLGFIGPPLRSSYEKYYGFAGDRGEAVLAKFREYYDDRGVHENTLIPGVETLLRALRAGGKTLLLATTKIELLAVRILEELGLAELFDHIAGAAPDGRLAEKDQVIRSALDRANVTDLRAAIMIGDSRYDAEGAHAVGLDMIGVLCGFGSRAELEEAGADVIVEDMEELGRLLL